MSETLLIINSQNEAQEFITNIILTLDKLIETVQKENIYLNSNNQNDKEEVDKLNKEKLQLLSLWYELGNTYKSNQNIILKKLKNQKEIVKKIDILLTKLDKVSSENMILSLSGIKL